MGNDPSQYPVIFDHAVDVQFHSANFVPLLFERSVFKFGLASFDRLPVSLVFK